MSVGAGSIKRAARTAKTGTAKKGDEAAVITGAEAEVVETEVMETEAGMAMQGNESVVTPETADDIGIVREPEEAADKISDKKGKQKKAEKQKKSGTLKKSETLKKPETPKKSETPKKPETPKKSETPKKLETPKKPGKKTVQPFVSAEDTNTSKNPDSHEAYGIGQQLPTYLL